MKTSLNSSPSAVTEEDFSSLISFPPMKIIYNVVHSNDTGMWTSAALDYFCLFYIELWYTVFMFIKDLQI